ncbi:MAG: CARDB domain-containing protein [Pirellulales bacterium]
MQSLGTKFLTGIAVVGMLIANAAPVSAQKRFGFGGGGGGGRGIGRALGGGNKKGLMGGNRPHLGAKLLGKNHVKGMRGQNKGYSQMFHDAQVFQGHKSFNHAKYNGLNEQPTLTSLGTPTSSSNTSNFFGNQQPSSGSDPSYSGSMASATPVASSTVPVATGAVPLLPLADLVLTDLRAMAPGNGSDLGPLFQMTIANQGPSASPAFQATIVAAASKEQLDSAATATAQVSTIEPGRSTQVEVRLPVEALALPDASGPTMFKVLGVALDDLNQVDELDEQNNRGLVYAEDIRGIDGAPVPQTEGAPSIASNWAGVPRMLSLPRSK